MPVRKMPKGGKIPPKAKPLNVLDSTALYNQYIGNTPDIVPATPIDNSPSSRFLGIEQDAYSRYTSKPQKAYPTTGEMTAPLTQGKLQGATPNKELLNDLIASADRIGVPREQMLALAANESMFGKGYQGGSRRSASNRGILQQNVISSWNMDEKYRPVSAAQFAYQKKIPGVKLDVRSSGYNYSVQDMDQYKNSLDSALTIHPEWIDQYQQANANVKSQGDINYFDLTAQALKEKGLGSSAFNPGDPDYANKVRQAEQLVTRDPVMRPYLRSTTPKMGSGGSIHFNSKEAYKKWLGYGHATGIFERTPGNQKVSIEGKNHKVKHAAYGDSLQPVYYNNPYVVNNQLQNPIPYQPYTPEIPNSEPLRQGLQNVSNYFSNEPTNMISNDASMQGPSFEQPEILLNADTDQISQSAYKPQSTTSSAPTPKQGGSKFKMPNIRLNTAAPIMALAGIVNATTQEKESAEEYARQARRNSMTQGYNPFPYGNGSQNIFKNGGKIPYKKGSTYNLTDKEIANLKRQGYQIEVIK